MAGLASRAQRSTRPPDLIAALFPWCGNDVAAPRHAVSSAEIASSRVVSNGATRGAVLHRVVTGRCAIEPDKAQERPYCNSATAAPFTSVSRLQVASQHRSGK